MRRAAFAAAALLWLAGCSHGPAAPPDSTYGPSPVLVKPTHALIPTVKVAPVVGWQNNMPTAAPGFTVKAFAAGLDHPRWLYVLRNGDVLVAETNAPPKPDDGKGIKGFFMGVFMKKAGAQVPSPNKLVLLRDTDNDGVADARFDFATGLNSPFGMALIGDTLYVADSDAIVKLPYHDGDTVASGAPVKVADLPAGRINHHWTKNIVASPDGMALYATIGSNSNAGENGLAAEEGRARIVKIDLATGTETEVAGGLRNPNGMDWQPQSGQLWTVVNERDELGDDLVPDYMTSVRPGAFYGWPFSYYGQHVDTRVKEPHPDMVAKAIPPDYALGAHTASLGLTFYRGTAFPAHYQGGAFIGQHGSWNRSTPSGYKVIFVPFGNGQPSGMPEDILSGFLDKDGKAMGRPVGVIEDKQGALLVADDVGNVIWRVTMQ